MYLVERKRDRALFAMKAIPKADAFSSDSRLSNLVAERVALAEASDAHSSFIIRLVDAFETHAYLCFVTHLASFGDLSDILVRMPDGKFSEHLARSIFAEIVLGLEESHRMGYLYRDMKLANLLVLGSGHLKLGDLGLAKKVEKTVDYTVDSGSEITSSSSSSSSEDDDDEPFRLIGRTKSFVGTRRYMAPELLQTRKTRHVGYGAPADVWAMGVTLYIMLTGKYPFARDASSRDHASMYYAIENEEIEFPEWLSSEAVSMLRGLLERDALERFELREIKSHAWMKGVDWEQVKFDAANDVPQEELVALLREQGLRPKEELISGGEKAAAGGQLFSSLSADSCEVLARRRKGVMESFNLLGFGYSSSEELPFLRS